MNSKLSLTDILEKYSNNPAGFSYHFTNVWFDPDGSKQEIYPKQLLFLNGKNMPHVVVVLKSRQIGFSSAIVAKVVHSAYFKKCPEILIISKIRPQAEKILRRIASAFDSMPEEIRPVFDKATQQQLILPNGVTINSLSAIPENARGYTGDVYLDEGGTFAKEDGYLIWTAVYPTITKGYTIHLVGTPQGKDNILYDLSTKTLSEFSKTDTTYDSLRMKVHWSEVPHVARNIDILRAGTTPLQFLQEFDLQFLDDSEETYFPRVLVEKCDTEQANKFGLIDCPYRQFVEGDIPEDKKYHYLFETFSMISTGWDMAKIQDHSIVSALGKRKDNGAWQLIGLFDLKGDYEYQSKCFSIISQLFLAHKCGYDDTSYGSVVREFLNKTRIAGKLVPVLFHPKTKIPMFSHMRGLMEQNNLWMPVSWKPENIEKHICEKLIWQFIGMEYNVLTQKLEAKTGEHDDIPCSIVCALEATRNKKSSARIIILGQK